MFFSTSQELYVGKGKQKHGWVYRVSIYKSQQDYSVVHKFKLATEHPLTAKLLDLKSHLDPGSR